jgi:hypothetical protein
VLLSDQPSNYLSHAANFPPCLLFTLANLSTGTFVWRHLVAAAFKLGSSGSHSSRTNNMYNPDLRLPPPEFPSTQPLMLPLTLLPGPASAAPSQCSTVDPARPVKQDRCLQKMSESTMQVDADIESAIGEDILRLTTEEINSRTRLLDNEMQSMKGELNRLKFQSKDLSEKVKENNDKIKLNKQLPYLVGNVVEVDN